MPSLPSQLPVRVPRFKVMRRVFRLALDPLNGFNRYLHEYGQSVLLEVGGSRSSIITTDPDLIQHVLQKNHRNYEKSEIQTDQMGKYIGYGLLTNTSESWLKQRRLIQPGFHKQRMQSLVDEMQLTIEKSFQQLDAQLLQTPRVNISQFTLRLTFDIIAKAIFTDGFNDEETRQLNTAVDRIQSFIIYPIRLPFLRPFIRWSGLEKRYQAIAAAVGQQILLRIEARRNSQSPKDDLLQMLLDSRYEDTGEPMDNQQLIDEIMILFAAGHETSANALGWIAYLLEKHPAETALAANEINDLLAAREPNFDDLKQLPYLTAIIEEAMRLFPPAWITDRVALADDDYKGYPIPKDRVVAPYIYGLHHREDFYPEPEKFMPHRMLAEQKKERHPYAFIPFGGGPRLCIGLHFAMMEMQLVLIHLLRNYQLSSAGQGIVQPKPFLTLRPIKPIFLNIRKQA